ncbi:hypothetical protein [Cryobacterium sp. Y82]|uniref:hypothetical protein n=1 Tax=Cryobacterium sp. Y82 TaxID=2045017 RepID=UPI000CE3654D|nr:hypothetical protein [Cryobacterium sp. Y82]
MPTPLNKKKLSGFTQLLLATAIAGVAGYVITWLVPRQVGFSAYASFAIFWSLLFFIVSALSGIQQEVTRATRPRTDQTLRARHQSVAFGAGTAVITFAVIVATAPAWVNTVFPINSWQLVWPLAAGAASYVLVAVLGGSLYGVSQWSALFWLICVEATLRFVAIAVALIFTSDIVALAWTIAAPYTLTLLVLWPRMTRSLAGKSELDVSLYRLCGNISRTIVAAASMGLMVSGFPFVLGLASVGEPAALLGLLILAVTLTRAPLIVVMMALQSYLIIHFRDLGDAVGARVFKIIGLLGALAVALALVGWWLGPVVFEFLFPGELVPEGWLLAVLVASSALMGALCVTSPALLASSRHTVYSVGWLLAAATTVVCLLLPLDLVAKTVLSLLAGPISGLLVHGSYLAIARRQSGVLSQS